MNPYGFVVENNDGLLTVNGHSYTYKKSENTNFAVLVSKNLQNLSGNRLNTVNILPILRIFSEAVL